MNRMPSPLHALLAAGAVLAAVGCAPGPVLTGRGTDTTARPEVAEPRAPGQVATAPERPVEAATKATASREPEAEAKAAPVSEQADPTETAPDETSGLGLALRDGLVVTGSAKRRIIHFTFDDGPDPRYTPALLDELDAAGVKATFFFSASRFHGRSQRSRQSMELAREVLRRGHQVGSHSSSHTRMSRMNRAEVVEQFDQSERAFEQVFGARTYLFRPPYGSRSAMVDRLLAGRGYTRVGWTIGLADWVEREPEQILLTWSRVLKRNEQNEGQRGGVVLMHDTDPRTAAAFRLIIEDIRQRNCELLRRGEELFDVVDDLSLFYVHRDEEPAGSEAPPAPVDEALFAERQAAAKEAAGQWCSQSVE